MSVDSYVDDDRLTYPGHPNPDQLDALDGILEDDPEVIVIGWHYPTDGPMIVRGDDTWQTILPDGTARELVRSCR